MSLETYYKRKFLHQKLIKNNKIDFIWATSEGEKEFSIALNSNQTGKENWGFIAKEQSKGVGGWKITQGTRLDIKNRGLLSKLV